MREILLPRGYAAVGVYDTEEEAAMAYNAAAIGLHGQFARLNILNGAA